MTFLRFTFVYSIYKRNFQWRAQLTRKTAEFFYFLLNVRRVLNAGCRYYYDTVY